MPDQTPSNSIELIDFGIDPPTNRLTYAERITHDGITVTRCLLRPNPGAMIGALQHTVIIHESEPFKLEWRMPDSEITELRQILTDDLHINSAERPMFMRWSGTPKALIIALEHAFVEQVASEAFNINSPPLRTMVAIRDPVITGMAVTWRQELAAHGGSGKLYAEHLGLALAIHLLRTYGDGSKRSNGVTGGLTTKRLRHITDYIDAHLDEDISLGDLAKIAGLGKHHFSDAFKTSTGQSPHRFLIEQRIRRAKELLLGTNQSVTQIALEVGFGSHSHFTEQFRKVTKTTPMRYRQERK